jgi:hypothetical protein
VLSKTFIAWFGVVLLGASAAVFPTRAQQGSTTRVTPPLTGSPTLTPIPPNTSGRANGLVPQTTFDPYSTQPNASLSPPSLLSPPSGTAPATNGPGTAQPYSYGQTAPQPQPNSQPYYGYQQPAPGYGTQNPPVLFPQGLSAPGAAATSTFGAPLKLFQNIRLSHAWLAGEDGNDLDINDSYVTTTLAFPNFLWSGQPWYVSPGFGLHLWSGPHDIATVTDPLPLPTREVFFPLLPSKAYSAFLDVGWKSDPNQTFGVELSGRVGVYSDFNEIDDASLRPQGVALLRLNLTPSFALKGGIEYINRTEIKLLPAFGILWTPNPQTRFDIYFPQPKLATYLTTLGNYEMWWYLGGEYGGDAWTTEVEYDVLDTPPGPPAVRRRHYIS